MGGQKIFQQKKIVMLHIVTLTKEELQGVLGTFEEWATQTIEMDHIPVIAVTFQKGSDGKTVNILRAGEYTNAQLKKMLIELSNAL